MPEKPPSGRYLHFVRHGQYEREHETGALTPVGRQQAAYLARHFRALRISALSSSDLPRAMETADILARELGIRAARRQPLLREVLPTAVPGLEIPAKTRREDARRLEHVVSRYFRPARGTRHEVLVCHGNLIRALMMRVTTGKLPGWFRFLIRHAGVTTFLVRPDRTSVLGFDVQEHIPARLRSEL